MKKKTMGKALTTAIMLTVLGGANLFGMSSVEAAGTLTFDSSDTGKTVPITGTPDKIELINAKNISVSGVKDYYVANGMNTIDLYLQADTLKADLLAAGTNNDVIYMKPDGEGYFEYLFKYYGGTNGLYLKTTADTNLTPDASGYTLVKHDKEFYFMDIVNGQVGVLVANPKVGSNVYITNKGTFLTGKLITPDGNYGLSSTLDLSQTDPSALANYNKIYGAINTGTGTVSGAKLIVDGQTLSGVTLYGGEGSTVNNNEVLIKSGTLGTNTAKVNIYGANGDGKGNKVTIEGGTIIAEEIAGAYDYAGADNNTLEIKGGNITADALYGGYARDGYSTSANNAVIISGDATINGNVYAATSNRENSNNTVTVSGTPNLAQASLNGYEYDSSNGGNTMTFDGYSGTVKSIGNFDTINLINTTNVVVTGNVDLSNAYNNEAKVVVKPQEQMAKLSKANPTLSFIKAANINKATTTTYYLGADDDPANVVNNGDKRPAYATTSNGMDYSYVQVNISDKEFSLTLVGDHVLAGEVDHLSYHKEQPLVITNEAAGYDYIFGSFDPIFSSTNSATVTLDTPVNLPNTTIGGNNSVNNFSGCQLNVSAAGSSVKNLKNFGTLNFDLPASINSGDTMLSLGEAYDMTGVKNVTVDGSKATNIHTGGTVDLVAAPSISNYSASVSMDGTLVSKDAKVEQEGNALRLTVLGEKPKEENGVKVSKAPVEAVAAIAAAINEGADLAAGGMLDNLSAIGSGADIFGAVGGSKSKYQTGSHVESNSWNIGLGMGKVNAHDKNTTSTGLFVEYGKSSFDTYNGSLKGDGKSFYRGVGLLGRVDNHSGNHYEGSLRVGRANTDWSNKDAGSYDDSATYYGLHAGFGHKLQVGKVQKLDFYGKYFYSHLGSMDGKLKEADYSFDSVNTHRIRVGTRLEYELKSKAKPYFGLAYEHTFNGDAKATMRFGNDSANPGTPSLKGNTGILEAGCSWTGRKVDLAAGIEGYTGIRKGISGNVNFNWKF